MVVQMTSAGKLDLRWVPEVAVVADCLEAGFSDKVFRQLPGFLDQQLPAGAY